MAPNDCRTADVAEWEFPGDEHVVRQIDRSTHVSNSTGEGKSRFVECKY